MVVRKNCIFRLFFTTVIRTGLLFVYKIQVIHNGPRSSSLWKLHSSPFVPSIFDLVQHRAPHRLNLMETEMLFKSTRGNPRKDLLIKFSFKNSSLTQCHQPLQEKQGPCFISAFFPTLLNKMNLVYYNIRKKQNKTQQSSIFLAHK